MGLLCGYLAAAAIMVGFAFAAMKRHLKSVLLGTADIVLTVLSIQGFKDMMISSGKILTPEWFGFGYNKPVLAVYGIMLTIGAAYVLVGVFGMLKGRSGSAAAQA